TNQMRFATSLAEDPTMRKLAAQILQAPPLPPTPPQRREFRPPSSPAQEQFVADFKPRLTQLGYEIAQLVNTNFMVVANSLSPQWGGNAELSDAHTNKFAELFASGEPVIITPFKPELLIQRRAGRIPPG